MLNPPHDLETSQVVQMIEQHWRWQVFQLTYVPVGFGAHHWAGETSGGKVFVTVHDLRLHGGAGDPLSSLRQTFRAARQLKDAAQLAFVVAALPSAAGEVVVRLGSDFALSVYDWLEVQPLEDPDGAVSASVLAQLHSASERFPRIEAPREDFAVPHRTALEEALSQLDLPWRTGPYGEPTRTLLAQHRTEVLRALESYDRMVEVSGREQRPWCLTHGEPNGWNLVQDDTGTPRLVDWDTACIAPPERDLWQLDHQPESLATYQRLMGRRAPDRNTLQLYRLWWDLAETAVYVMQFRAAHTDDANMAESWKNLQIYLPTAERWRTLDG